MTPSDSSTPSRTGPDHAGVSTVVEDDMSFTLDELCRACAADRSQVLALVAEGVLDPSGAGPHDWVFAGPAMRTVRTTVRLVIDLDLSWAGAAVVFDLLQQVDTLQLRLTRAGI